MERNPDSLRLITKSYKKAFHDAIARIKHSFQVTFGSLLKSMSTLFSLLKTKHFDDNTPTGRAASRTRTIILTSLTSMVARISTAIISLITVPLALDYLGDARYGLWMAISSFISFFTFADFGVGNGVFNAVATAYGRRDTTGMRRTISSAYVLLFFVASALLFLFAVIQRYLPWDFPVATEPTAVIATENRSTATVLFVCFALSLPLGLIHRVQVAMQRGVTANVWQIAASLCSLLSLLAVIRFQKGLPWLAAASAGTPLFFYLINSLIFFLFLAPKLRPSFNCVDRGTTSRIAKASLLFLIIQIAWPIIVSSDAVFIAHFLGTDAVTQYAVPEKIFSLVPLLVGLTLQPLWAAFGEALARGDLTWVKVTHRKALQLSAIVALSIVIPSAIFGRTILTLWVGDTICPSFFLLTGLAAWKTVEVIGAATAFLLNAAHRLRFQALVNVTTAAACIVLKIVLIPLFGVAGSAWATFFAFTFFTLIPYHLYLRREFPGPAPHFSYESRTHA